MSDESAIAAGPARAVVIGHGAFASGLISAVEQITGRGGLLVGISNTGMTPATMDAAIAAQLDAGISVVFTDLPAGSATICAKRACGRSPSAVVVSGVNLPALLDFVMSEDASPEAAISAAHRGRETLCAVGRR